MQSSGQFVEKLIAINSFEVVMEQSLYHAIKSKVSENSEFCELYSDLSVVLNAVIDAK